MSVFKEFLDQKTIELSNQEFQCVADFFRNEFDNMTELVKLFQRKKGRIKGTAYKTIAELALNQNIKRLDGKELTVSQVCRYMNIVRAERKGVPKAVRKIVAVSPAVSSETVAVSVPEPVARPGAVPGAIKPVVVPVAPVNGSDAIPERITGYQTMIELEKWDKLFDQDFWNDETEILYGQVRLYIFRNTDNHEKPILNVIRSELNSQPNFSKSLADTVEHLFKVREKYIGKAHWQF